MSELQPTVQIHAEVTRAIRQHCRSSMTTEVCGVLIGDLTESPAAVNIFASIAATNAAQAGTHVTFTQDAWEGIYKVKDATYPDDRIVGWYHSHPGFGVFLSEHDTFIQQNFFSAPTQVAWVFDPHTDEEGCFGWVDGTITRLETLSILDRGTPVTHTEPALPDPDEAAADPAPRRSRRTRIGHPPRWLRWTASLSALLAALLLGFAVSHILFPAVYPLVLPVNPLTGQALLRDPKTGDPVYMDPQTGKYVVSDRRTGKLSSIDPQALRPTSTLPPAGANPFPQPVPTAPPGPSKEKP